MASTLHSPEPGPSVGVAAPSDELACPSGSPDDLSDRSYASSDGELEWDPDRERLLRNLRLTHADGNGNWTSQKSVAQRRSEWRESRGLPVQRSVAQILAERRQAREEARGSHLPATSHLSSTSHLSGGGGSPAPRPPPQPPSDRAPSPISADRALDLGGRGGAAERAAELRPLPLGAAMSASPLSGESGGADVRSVSGADDSSARDPHGDGRSGKKRSGWPWRTR